jgi:hypothetical protein
MELAVRLNIIGNSRLDAGKDERSPPTEAQHRPVAGMAAVRRAELIEQGQAK